MAAGRGGKREGAGRPAAAGESLESARRRKERALADLRELEVRHKRGELLDAEEVKREWQDVFRQVRAGMLAVVSRVRAKVPTLDSHTVQVLDAEIRNALTALGTGQELLEEHADPR